MKVLLVIPKVSGRFPGADIPHLGVGYLAAMLIKSGIEVQILDTRLGYSHREVHKTVEAFNPQLVGVTVYSLRYQRAYSLIREIGNRADYKIVIGGPHISAVGAKALRESEADFAVKGEGEETFLELCKAIEKSSLDYGNIPGLVWRCGNEVIENKDRSFIGQLDNLPFPAHNQFELEKYFCYKDRLLPLITSRGCPHHCIFCSVNLSMGRKFRPRTPDNVVNEIEYWYDQGWRKFEFHDDNFSCDIHRAKRICDLLVKKDLGIEWSLPNGVRVDRLDEKLLEKMKASGCSRVAFGIESAHNDVLKKIKKGVKIEQVEDAIEMVRKVGIDIVGFFIVGHPTESYHHSMQSLVFARRQPFDQINFYNLVPYPGTELLKWVKENGTLLYPEEVYLNKISYWEAKPIFETPDFSAKERRKAYRLGHSLERKSISRLKLGRFWGKIGWLLSSLSILERTGIWMIKGTKIGRRLYGVLVSQRKKSVLDATSAGRTRYFRESGGVRKEVCLMRKTSDELVKHTGIMVMSTIIANISLLFFHAYMSRTLGPASFGILVSFLAICFIVGLPVTSIQTVMAKYVSSFKVKNQQGKIGYLLRDSFKKMLLYGGLGLGIFILASAKIGSFLQIEARKPVILLGIVLFLSLFVPVVRGTLQGLQKFGHLGTNVLFEGISRVLLGVLLVYLGLGVNGAVEGIGLGYLLVVLVAFIPLGSLLKREKSIEGRISSAEIYAYFWPVSLGLLCFVLLANMDIIFVKHFFAPVEAGYYSVLSVVGRGFLTLALAVSMVMFPKVSELETRKKDSSSILKKSLLIGASLCGVGILICFFFPRFIIATVFGSKYLDISSLLRVFVVAISPLMMVHLLINYNLARHRNNFLYILVFGVAFYVIMLSLFHRSLGQVVLVLGGVGCLVLVVNLALVFFPLGRTGKERRCGELGY